MSDPFNVGNETETPHGKAQSYKTNQKAKADEAAGSTDYAKLYDQGLALFKRAGFELVRSAAGTHCGHNVYRKVSPKPIPGISYPHWFQYLRLVESVEDDTVLANAMLKGKDSGHVELQQFWSPVTQPMSGARSSPLQGYVDRLAKIDESRLDQNEAEPIRLGIQLNSFTHATAKQDETPRAFVPPKEWFDDKLHSLTFRDIFTLWPEAETSMLQLIVGRVLAGRSGSVPIGDSKVLEHTYRTVGIVIGEDPGLGKSTIFEKLFEAINCVGYRRVNFRDISERFGLSDVAESDVAYKDDVTGKTLRHLIGSENTKIIASGGRMTGENKFEKARSSLSRTVLLANTNVWDPREAYNLDPGTVDRIKLLSTYRRNALQKAGAKCCSEQATGSPDFAPFIHIPWLADQLGVSQQALMLWACRLAVDEFTKYTFWRGDVPNEALRLRIHDLSSRLTYSFNKDSTRALVSCMLFSHILLTHLSNSRLKLKPYAWKELSEVMLKNSFRDFKAVASDANLYRLRSLLRAHWEQNGRPDTHPWAGIRKLNVLSMRPAYGAMNECLSRKAPLGELVKSTFGELTLRDGFKGSSDIVWVTAAWEACKGYMEDIEALARAVDNIVSDAAEDQMSAVADSLAKLTTGLPDDSWLDLPDYTPERVSEIMPQDKDMAIEQYFDVLAETKWLN